MPSRQSGVRVAPVGIARRGDPETNENRLQLLGQLQTVGKASVSLWGRDFVTISQSTNTVIVDGIKELIVEKCNSEFIGRSADAFRGWDPETSLNAMIQPVPSSR